MTYILKLKNNKFLFFTLLSFVILLGLFFVNLSAKANAPLSSFDCCVRFEFDDDNFTKKNNVECAGLKPEMDARCYPKVCDTFLPKASFPLLYDVRKEFAPYNWHGLFKEPYKEYDTYHSNCEITKSINKIKCVKEENLCASALKELVEARGDIFPSCEQNKTPEKCTDKLCIWANSINECISTLSSAKCSFLNNSECSQVSACSWSSGKCIGRIQQSIEQDYLAGRSTSSKFLPPCALTGTCTEINEIMFVAILAAKEVFKYIGALAFIFFVYGGFTMILSFGNAEKVKKGKSVLVAAVVGLLISFGAYFIVDFVLTALNVSAGFKL
ncbi:hypothetical protein COV24_04770 [candidate division WWE3 bacterium CG10_big_fil_rev_8_21_14_0_10_32_10]|uniref:Uncharacterized protein n=1 Tax=candidate division WWE3 bacterium CG10_big_fil_rev_8_21_14_0_10_32_10 TaxID=1975090 RepID=A0A2H0R977_UNCKA|nr:MAG: hypothetical protein COV24_04770 [candidate division WWE3 bacterium CG10_big_fil_rev_8_21_14_0_10_32_10]